jgi:glucosylceramidase
MKSTGSMCGGRLLRECYPVAARYYRMAVQAYAERGIPIHAFTLQNEPLMVHRRYPTCKFTWDEQRDFLHLVRREFDDHRLETEIWIFDHNFQDAMRYPARILQDPAAYRAADGVAFHAYEGRVEQMGAFHARFPEMPLYFTEYSTWRARGIEQVLSYFRNGARSYNAWVTCLDDKRQPNAGPHHASPTFVTVDSRDPSRYAYIPEYHLLGQVSKFVQRGAVRVASDPGSPDAVTGAAFLNPDGSLILVAVNQTGRAQRFRVLTEEQQFLASIPHETVATYRWMSRNAASSGAEQTMV